MNKKNKKTNSNNSMFLYTALIFVVALILIIIAFFGQKNLTALRRETDAMGGTEQIEEATATDIPVLEETTPSPQPTERSNTDIAVMTNTISHLQAENTELKDTVNVYEKLLAANGYISAGNITEAENMLSDIDSTNLTGDQQILYNQILTTINEGKE